MKIIQLLENSGLLFEGTTYTIENEEKEQTERFLGMLLVTPDASLLVNMLTGKGMLRAGYGTKGGYGTTGDGILRAGYGFLMLHYLLINFEIQHYYNNEPRFHGVYKMNDLLTACLQVRAL